LAEKDVIVIGGGTAGFLASQMASQFGADVVLVEKERVGGICPNWGCIPMCFMDHCVEVLTMAKNAEKDGINVGKVNVDFKKLISEKEKVVQGVVAGMEARLQASGVQVVIGTAKLTSPNQVAVDFSNGKKDIFKVKKIIIATGSVARRYDIPGAYGSGVLTTRELLDLTELPKSLAIIGRSVTALEIATVWANLGCDVSIIARRPQFLPGEDEELAAYIQHTLEEDGVKIYAGVNIERIDDSEKGKSITISDNGVKQNVEAQFVVFALGQSPLVENLGLENVGINITDGRIKTNEKMETSVSGIYAVGDVTGGMMLASVAMSQGIVAANNVMGRAAAMDYRSVTRSIRTSPPIAAVGMTEVEAKEKGLDIKIAKFPFEQNPKANISRERGGFVKIIADSTSGEILGAHIIGPQAPELIHEISAVMQMRGTARDIAACIHGHPTLHETIQRTAQDLFIQVFSK
jgi:dihydrolipoamide dehydrogenase